MNARVGVAVSASVAAAALAGAVALGGALEGDAPASAGAPPQTRTASVQRTDLRETEIVDGTLGYAGGRSVASSTDGVVTAVPKPGAKVARGGRLYAVAGARAATLMYGDLPAYRRLAAGASRGRDIRQLERNLHALGFDRGLSMTVDRSFTYATAAAVRRWQAATGQTETGAVELGSVVFAPGAARVRSVAARLGQALRRGQPVLELTSTRRQVEARLDASRQHVVDVGDPVDVELPSGATVRGRVVDVGAVARRAAPDAPLTITVRIALRGRAARLDGLVSAPVGVTITSDVRRSVLVVPVEALTALRGGGFGVEVLSGRGSRTVPVETGLFSEGSVEVEAAGLRAGTKVMTAE